MAADPFPPYGGPERVFNPELSQAELEVDLVWPGATEARPVDKDGVPAAWPKKA